MAMNLKNKKILIVDYGYFVEIAIRLARDFEEVHYYCVWEEACPTYHKYIIGSGIPNIKKVYNLWDSLDECDEIFFPHLYHGAFQSWLRSTGRPVFGSGRGEEMEIYRDRMKHLQMELGLDVNEYKVIKGLTPLREFLKINSDKFIKTNILRGAMESWKHENYDLSKPVLDEMEHSLGVYKDEETFIIEDPIENAVEIGWDGFVIDGKFPDKQITGIEIKGCSYIGAMVDYNSLPNVLKNINEKLSLTFNEYNYRGHYSNEVRYTKDGKGYLIDQTCRNPEPNTSLALEMYDNYSEIIWDVAHGIVPEIKYKYKFGVQVLIKSVWAISEPVAIYFPEEYRNNIKIHNLCIDKGVYYTIPHATGYSPQTSDVEGVGSVIGMGNTLKEAITQAQMIASKVKGYCLKTECDSLDTAQEEIEKLKKFGIKLW